MNDQFFGNDITQLREEHRVLDQKINEALLHAGHDQLAVQRMKKRKLQIKDRILLFEAQEVSTTPDAAQQAGLRQRLKKLKQDHARVDKELNQLMALPLHDQIMARTYKKRKLYLKEEILKIESMLLPDTLA